MSAQKELYTDMACWFSLLYLVEKLGKQVIRGVAAV